MTSEAIYAINLSMKCFESEYIKLKSENKYLKEQLAWLQRQLFGKRSEKVVADFDSNTQLLPGIEEHFQNVEKEEKIERQEISGYTKIKSKKDSSDQLSYPDDLPVEQRIIDLPEVEKICSETNQPLVKIGEEVTRKLAKKPDSFFIIEYVRPKYAMPKGTLGGIKTAGLPECILPKCQVDDSVLVDVICRKFLDHLPLYRISDIYSRDNIRISRQLLSQWILKIGTALEPLYKALEKRVLSSGNIFVDETPIELLEKGRGQTKKAYMWAVAGGRSQDPPDRIYFFCYDRKHKYIQNLLSDYSGIFHSDKFNAYEKLAHDRSKVWCPCWAHIRRKFIECESGDKQFIAWCLRKIKYLFMLDRVAWSRSEEERLKIRQEKSLPIIDEINRAIEDKFCNGKKLPKSKYREALGYFYGLTPYLRNYTKYSYARLDNSVVERAIRPLAIGRKNWLFFGSQNGGIAAGRILSIVQTCKAYSINPREYLEDVFSRLLSHSTQNLEELLPGSWKKLAS